ncbi:MAG TPA: hypothetical protein VND19_02150 [Acetobacteraceae bacterium]|nr:hypothetical protein [Acetobacteraceae bacterium]
MVRDALRERFVVTLQELGDHAGNGRLRSELGWQEDTYRAVHAALIDAGVVVPGRGRGARQPGARQPGARQDGPAREVPQRQWRGRLRANLQQHRQRAAHGARLHHRARLHRANLMDAVPEIPR